MRILIRVILFAGIVLWLSGCGSSEKGNDNSTPPAPPQVNELETPPMPGIS